MKRLLTPSLLILTALTAGCVSSPRINMTPLPVDVRAQEIQDMRWGMFVCWSFSTFSGREWTKTLDKDDPFSEATEGTLFGKKTNVIAPIGRFSEEE